ncbi:hypothetical protein ACFELO_04405 [Oceanicaulis sp. LC35]|uniref:hypothetical protein n=1 Tax=Oceanicaulis sp. LC35 TaxID=3349635 RepID=UPI003F851FE1
MPEIGVLRYTMHGLETNDITARSQVLLCERLNNEPQWSGVIFDYSKCTVSYTLSEFTERLGYIVTHMPRRVKIAYIFNPQTLVVSARASKLLTCSGVNAQAFPSVQEAIEYLKGDENWRRAGNA